MSRIKLTELKSGLATLPSRLPTAPKPAPNYAKGRGGRPWRRLRDAVLQRDKYLCQPCKANGFVTEATMVDHIIPQAEGGTDDRVNLQSICTECHQAKTNEERRRGVHRHFRG